MSNRPSEYVTLIIYGVCKEPETNPYIGSKYLLTKGKKIITIFLKIMMQEGIQHLLGQM